MEWFDIWSFLIGVVFILIPALIFNWSEKEGEANRIAHQLAIDAWRFIEEERDKVGYDVFGGSDDEDVFPLDNDDFHIIKSSKGVSWYSKKYDTWFLRDTFIYYCDSNQNVKCIIKEPHQFNLKKHLIPDKDVMKINKG